MKAWYVPKVMTGIGNSKGDIFPSIRLSSDDWSKPIRAISFCLTRIRSGTIVKTQWNLRENLGLHIFPHFEEI